MHQQPRQPARSSSRASPSQPPTTWSNPPRDAPSGGRQRANSRSSATDGPSSPRIDAASAGGPPSESIKKLDQIVQNFFIKVAVLVLNARIQVKPSRNANGINRMNKWFQIETEEVDDFKEELRIWKTAGTYESRPPTMIIEVYLDTSTLKENQTLVTIDEEGRRWDVLEQLNASESSDGTNSLEATSKTSEVVLERWRVELKPLRTLPVEDFGPVLPTTYKKAIIFFRSLFITTRLLPAWKYASHLSTKSTHPALAPRCRIRAERSEKRGADILRRPIDGKMEPVTDYVFADLDLPVGRLCSTVSYRSDCNFQVDDSETLLSSRFMTGDENLFRPSMPQRLAQRQREPTVESGSLRDHRRRPPLENLGQTYGSLSTFHGEGLTGTSPMSALRAIKAPGSDTDSPPASLPTNSDPDPPNSLPISRRLSINRPSLRAGESSSRRASISFQPFKAGSLSGSPIPRQTELEPPPSPHSANRPIVPSALSQPRNRSSLTAGMPASLRGGPPAASETPLSSSPRPQSSSRYSSSFGHRRSRPSIGGTSRAGDEDLGGGSSGRQSLSSSVAQPGSGLLAEAEAASSGSLQGEEGNINDFLRALDSKKTLKSFEAKKPGESATNRTVAQLSKFHMMKESNAALTDSMTSSMHMQRSSATSSRGSVPAMVAPTSISASSSPGKPLSPHTPHTPAVPSRLGAGSLEDNSVIPSRRPSSRQRRTQEPTVPEVSRENTITQAGTTAIDIPMSPRAAPHQRRSSSVAYQSRIPAEVEDSDSALQPHRSTSLGAQKRGEPPTMSAMLARQPESDVASSTRESLVGALQPPAEILTSPVPDSLPRSSATDNPSDVIPGVGSASSPFGRRRYTGMGGQARPTPPQSSRGSFASMSKAPRGDDDSLNDEPFVFDFQETDAQGRRSLEEGRGGGRAGSDRGGYETRGTTRRGW